MIQERLSWLGVYPGIGCFGWMVSVVYAHRVFGFQLTPHVLTLRPQRGMAY